MHTLVDNILHPAGGTCPTERGSDLPSVTRLIVLALEISLRETRPPSQRKLVDEEPLENEAKRGEGLSTRETFLSALSPALRWMPGIYKCQSITPAWKGSQSPREGAGYTDASAGHTEGSLLVAEA